MTGQNKYRAIVIGGSAGSFPVITSLLSELPADFPLPIIMCLHRLKHIRHGFMEALSIKSKLEIIEPDDKESIRSSKIYLAPANYHMCVELGNFFSLSTEGLVNNSRPAIDLTLDTASYVYKQNLIAILLSGANKDGALGMKKVKDRGGLTIVQEPKDCVIDTMPTAALNMSKIDHIFNRQEITDFLLKL